MGCASSQPAADVAAPAAARSAPQGGASALERAVASSDTAAVSAALRAGAPLQDGSSLLRLAAERDDVATARLLLARGADAKARSGGGSPNSRTGALSALEAGAAAGAAAAVALLLDHGGGTADKDAALAFAARNGHCGAAAVLLTAGASPAAVLGMDGRAALHHAAMGGHAACVRALTPRRVQLQFEYEAICKTEAQKA